MEIYTLFKKLLIACLFVVLTLDGKKTSDSSTTPLKGILNPQPCPLLETLVSNPLVALQNTHAVYEQYASTAKKQGLDINKLTKKEFVPLWQEIKGRFENESPIFLLGECFGECSLSRSYHPEYREAFEKKTVTTLVATLNSTDEPVHYVGFASGRMFQDLVILVKALTKKPNATIVIHLIDVKNSIYVTCRDLIGDAHEVSAKSCINPEPIMEAFKKTARTEGGINDMDDKELEKQLALTVLTGEQPYIQYISYLQNSFPQAHVSLHVHDTAEQYLAYLDKYDLPYPDIITAADIQDEMSFTQGCNDAYTKLCVKVLQENPSSHAIWLAKKDIDTAEILTIHVKKVANAQKKTLEADNIKTSFYLKAKEIPVKIV